MQMNRDFASLVAEAELNKLRITSYQDLVKRIDNPEHKQVTGPDGHSWCVEVNVSWDDGARKKNLRVMVAVDDGSRKAFMLPLSRDTVVGPDGEL